MKILSLSYSMLSVWLLQCFLGVNAQKVGLKSELGFGCFNCALNWNFDCPNEVLPFDCRCSRDDFLTTAMNCVAQNAKDIDEVVNGWNYIRSQCHYWGSRTMSIEQLQQIYYENRVNMVEPDSFNSTIAPGPISVPQSLLDRQLVSARDTKFHYNVGNYFACAIIGYWGFVIIAGILTNAIRVLCPNIYNVFGNGKVTALRKYLTLPPMIGKKHHSHYQLFRYVSIRVPTRGQFFIIMGFVALNIAAIVSFISVEGDSPLAFLDQSDRKLHYLANRTGIIAFGHIPVLVLFACRNNPFIYFTGWPYDTFMMYHRWCARFMGTHAIIHALAIYWSSFSEKVVLFKWHHVHNWRGGNLAVYMVIIMMTMGLRAIRSRIYETFKATHVLMFLIFIICLIVHCSDYGWLAWLWTSIAFYAIEYISRVKAVIMSGGIQNAKFTLTEAGMYRVRIFGDRKWDVKPGAYVYIRILDKNMFWQSHPFSVFQGPISEKNNSIDLCCKAQLGSTRRTLQKLIATPEKNFNCKVMIEGPYGNENYICDYDSIFLFAGGVGFTAMYNFASHLTKRLQVTQKVSLVWVVKDCQHLQAFEPELAFLTRNSNDNFTFRIFVTKPEEMAFGSVALTNMLEEDASSRYDKSREEPTQLFDPSHLALDGYAKGGSGNDQEEVSRRSITDDSEDACKIVVDGDVLLNIEYGRPDISVAVSDFIRTANGTKAICSCGPPMFVDAIREGIVESIMESDSRVDYFEDAFSW